MIWVIFLDLISILLNKCDKKTLYTFFRNKNVILNDYELSTLFNYIKINSNKINERNYQSFLYSSNLKLPLELKNKIYNVLVRFV